MDKYTKDKKTAWKLEHKQKNREKFPVREQLLDELFDYLDTELSKKQCDHSRNITLSWIKAKDLSEAPILEWLDDNGGYCDCEVLANVEDHFEQNR